MGACSNDTISRRLLATWGDGSCASEGDSEAPGSMTLPTWFASDHSKALDRRIW